MDLANTLRDERKTSEIKQVDKNFYELVGTYLAGLEQELSKIDDRYCTEAQIIQDTLKSERNSLAKLIDQRMKKIVRRAMKNARSASKGEDISGLTPEESLVYGQIIAAIAGGREVILAQINRTERPLTGKKDISREYEIVRLLDSVPEFVGIDGRNYLLNRDDVVSLPAVHARNLRNKRLAVEVKSR